MLSIKKQEDGQIRVSSGELSEEGVFLRDRTVIVSQDRPNLLWNLVYELSDIPLPKLPNDPPPIVQHLESSPKSIDKIEEEDEQEYELEMELKEMTSKDIIKRVHEETGIEINISPKSKKSIIKRAVKFLYHSHNNVLKMPRAGLEPAQP